jgi:hypothetical protein
MNKVAFSVIGAVLLITGCGVPSENTDNGLYGSDGSALSASTKQKISELKAATDKYHDVNVALADGFQPISPCITSPWGGMGYHYMNFTRAFGGVPLTEMTPTSLLYEDDPYTPGAVRLVGVEYFSFIFQDGQPFVGGSPDPEPAPRPESIQARPVLYGGDAYFAGPMPGHGGGMPWHYDLHAYIWRGSSQGVFDEWNTNVYCRP